MLARLLIFALLSGVATTGVGIGMGLPIWMLLLTYSLAGSAALILGGVLAVLAETRQATGFGRTQVDPAPIRIRR